MSTIDELLIKTPSDNIPNDSEFLQGVWDIDPDAKHTDLVIATVSGTSVKFSDYPNDVYTLTFKSNTWHVNGWNLDRLKGDRSVMIMNKSGEVNARWVRPPSWRISKDQQDTKPEVDCSNCTLGTKSPISCANGNCLCAKECISSYISKLIDDNNLAAKVLPFDRIQCMNPSCSEGYLISTIALYLSSQERKRFLDALK